MYHSVPGCVEVSLGLYTNYKIHVQDAIKTGKDKLSAAYSGAADLLSGWGSKGKADEAGTAEL